MYNNFNGKTYHHDKSCVAISRESRVSLQWRHNGHDGVSNHQPNDCLFYHLFKHRSKKTSKLRVTGICEGNSPETGEFPHKGPVTRKMFPFDDVIMLVELRVMPKYTRGKGRKHGSGWNIWSVVRGARMCGAALRPRQNCRNYTDDISKCIFEWKCSNFAYDSVEVCSRGSN